jgi:alpha-tubulin suppressor-like RCC1 family protein
VDKPLPPGRVKPQLVNEGDMAVFLAPDGSIWAWGGTEFNLMNVFPKPTVAPIPQRIGSQADWVQVASGGIEQTVALKNDGSLWAWGWNTEGGAGQGNISKRFVVPTRIGTETDWTQICSGAAHCLALKRDGSLWSWGWNYYGQLGNGSTNNRSVPTVIGTDRDWCRIMAETFCSVALKSNGTIWGWGHINGRDDLTPKQIEAGTNWQAISAHDNTLLAVKTDGTLWLKSVDANGVASEVFSGPITNFSQIGKDTDWTTPYAATDSFFARKSDGSYWAGGQNYFGQLGLRVGMKALPSPRRLPFDFEPWAFAPGDGTTLMLGRDGNLWTWGRRLGVEQPSAARKKFEALIAPAVRRFPSLRFLIKSDIDRTPHLLWELPPEVRRSLGSPPDDPTNKLTTTRILPILSTN